jgi:hypothetical protein
VRRRCDHPKGVRPKSRVERVVDLHEPMTLDGPNLAKGQILANVSLCRVFQW